MYSLMNKYELSLQLGTIMYWAQVKWKLKLLITQ